MSNSAKPEVSKRIGSVGGQAVLEGVMMKSGDDLAISVRRENGTIVMRKKKFISVRKKIKFFDLPVIRGVVNFVEMLSMSMTTLNESADLLGIDDDIKKDNPKKEKNNDKKGISVTAVASVIGAVLGLALSFGLFFYLPTLIGGLIPDIADKTWLRSPIEGIARMAIFIVYLLLVSLMKDIRRTFEYHGAEHMSVFCYESGDDLTVENVKKYSRFHPRCGTSFMIIMMIIGIIIAMFIPFTDVLLRMLTKLAVFPVVIGIGYEFIRFAGKHDNVIVRIVSAPGIWVQHLTTKQPDDKQIEVAINSLKAALPDVFPPEETDYTLEQNIDKKDNG